MIKADTKPIRITVHKKMHEVLEKKAQEQGLKIATYVRDLVMKSLREQGEDL